MFNHKTWLAAFGAAVLGLAVAAGSGQAWTMDKTTYLTFSGAVALPGVVLPAGTYTFELADPMININVVRVLSRNRSKVYFMGFTAPVNRTASEARSVTFGEAPAGSPPRIAVWYPKDDSIGHQFLYR